MPLKKMYIFDHRGAEPILIDIIVCDYTGFGILKKYNKAMGYNQAGCSWTDNAPWVAEQYRKMRKRTP